jgi:hypothetical protein
VRGRLLLQLSKLASDPNGEMCRIPAANDTLAGLPALQ